MSVPVGVTVAIGVAVGGVVVLVGVAVTVGVAVAVEPGGGVGVGVTVGGVGGVAVAVATFRPAMVTVAFDGVPSSAPPVCPLKVSVKSRLMVAPLFKIGTDSPRLL